MKASIIIRTYNNEESIKRVIESALLQDFSKKDYEVIVINDGSTDKTKDILRK
jgi:glycosyltransferase involved in cell wall biosynthesis